MTEYYQGLADDGTKFNARARAFLQDKGVQLKGNGGGGGGSDEGGDEDGGSSGGGSGGGGSNNNAAGYKPVGPSGVRNAVNLEALQTRIHSWVWSLLAWYNQMLRYLANSKEIRFYFLELFN